MIEDKFKTYYAVIPSLIDVEQYSQPVSSRFFTGNTSDKFFGAGNYFFERSNFSGSKYLKTPYSQGDLKQIFKNAGEIFLFEELVSSKYYAKYLAEEGDNDACLLRKCPIFKIRVLSSDKEKWENIKINIEEKSLGIAYKTLRHLSEAKLISVYIDDFYHIEFDDLDNSSENNCLCCIL